MGLKVETSILTIARFVASVFMMANTSQETTPPLQWLLNFFSTILWKLRKVDNHNDDKLKTVGERERDFRQKQLINNLFKVEFFPGKLRIERDGEGKRLQRWVIHYCQHRNIGWEGKK